jgi:hypothetical protein
VTEPLHELADALLYEGYLLYPYSGAALKNVHRYPFGTLYPEAFCRAEDAGDASLARLECVVFGADARVSIEARFLQLEAGGAVARIVHAPHTGLAELARVERHVAFELSPLRGELVLCAAELDGGARKLSVTLRNRTVNEGRAWASRDEALSSALLSAHLLLRCEAGEFVSAIDPPAEARAMVESCRSVGMWPVLSGRPGSRDALLASPIILNDYPELAPESPGDFFDGTETDALLVLRILTLTDDEKQAMREGDPQARALLARTEAEGLARLARLHGRLAPRADLRPGARVRIKPRRRADILDLALAGKQATIEAVEHDLEGRAYVAVTVDDDPGKDLGAYGHRFFFAPEEVELL